MTAESPLAAPVVSVVCPIFNSANYLEETLDSVLAQDFDNFELLLIDDGSTDRSESIARAYAERHRDRVRFFTHPNAANRGTAATRNLGIHHGRGRFLAFIDSDDRWRPEKLREQLAIFAADPRVDLVAGTANYWQRWSGGNDRLVPSGHVRNRLICPPEASLRIYPLAKAAAPCPSDLLVRAELVRRIGGFEEEFLGPLTLYEDQAFLSKLYLVGNVYFADRVWIDYRLHDQSAMRRQLDAGRYDEIREYFLDWFADYLRTRRVPHAVRVGLAVRLALLRYRQPRLARLWRVVRRGSRRLRGRGAAHSGLP